MALRSRGKSNFPYAVARVQAKRAKLIPQDEYQKMLKMDISEITRYIQDSAYKAEVDELSSRFSGLDLTEAALTVNEERTYHSVRRLLDGEAAQLLGLFLERHLVNDLKTVLRGKNSGASRDELLKELLLEDLDTYNIFQPLLADDISRPEEVAQALVRQGGIARHWGQVLVELGDKPLRFYEDALDKAYYHQLISSLSDSSQAGAKEMLAFIRHEVDALNLVNAARWVATGQTEDFSAYVVPGGHHVKVADAVNLSRSKDLGAYQEGIKDLPFAPEIRPALEEAQKSGRLSRYEAAVKRSINADLRRLSHQHPLSIVPILLFLLRKRQEVVTIRAIARGKSSGLGEERLQELIE